MYLACVRVELDTPLRPEELSSLERVEMNIENNLLATFFRNIQAIEILVDHDAIMSGAANGSSWRYYDLAQLTRDKKAEDVYDAYERRRCQKKLYGHKRLSVQCFLD